MEKSHQVELLTSFGGGGINQGFWCQGQIILVLPPPCPLRGVRGVVPQAKEGQRRVALLKRAMKVLDPETIAAQHLLPRDQEIKEKDLPERYQLAGVEVGAAAVAAGVAACWRSLSICTCMYSSCLCSSCWVASMDAARASGLPKAGGAAGAAAAADALVPVVGHTRGEAMVR